MADVLITIDTELSAGLHQRGVSPEANHAASIDGIVAGEAVGIGWQMDRMEARGLTGVFFVDPMPEVVYGPDIVSRIVEPILARGHEVQLHLHPECLAWAASSPMGEGRGRNIGDFTLGDQVTLIALARDLRACPRRPRSARAISARTDER